MTKNTTYICDYCGEVFDNYDDCYRHEWEHKLEPLKNRIKLMKEKNGVFIELPLAYESVNKCAVIYCDGTNDAWNALDEIFDWKGYYCVPEAIRADGHIFIYDSKTEEWFCLEKGLDYFAKLNAEINKIIEGK